MKNVSINLIRCLFSWPADEDSLFSRLSVGWTPLSSFLLVPLFGALLFFCAGSVLCAGPAAAADEAPGITVPGEQSVPSGALLIFSDAGNNPIRVQDAEGVAIRLDIRASCGILTVSGSTGIQIDGRNTATMTLTGPAADINTELNGLRFTPSSGEEQYCRLDLTAQYMTEDSGTALERVRVYFFAPGGPDLFGEEGTTVRLPALPSNAADILWEQTSGPVVGISDASTMAPTFVPPPVNNALVNLSFSATYFLNSSSETRNVSVRIVDNGITGLPSDAVSFYTPDHLEMGIRLSAGHLTELSTLPPDAVMTEDRNRPSSLPFGLISFIIATPNPGDRITAEIFLPWAAAPEENWYKYDEYSGWYPLNDAEFLADRTRVRITLTDGGSGDGDFAVNSRISDPSALGAPPDTAKNPDMADGSGGDGDSDGGGCFLGRMRAMMEMMGY